MRQKPKFKRLHVHIEDWLFEKLKELAKQERVTLTWLVESSLLQLIEETESAKDFNKIKNQT